MKKLTQYFLLLFLISGFMIFGCGKKKKADTFEKAKVLAVILPDTIESGVPLTVKLITAYSDSSQSFQSINRIQEKKNEIILEPITRVSHDKQFPENRRSEVHRIEIPNLQEGVYQLNVIAHSDTFSAHTTVSSTPPIEQFRWTFIVKGDSLNPIANEPVGFELENDDFQLGLTDETGRWDYMSDCQSEQIEYILTVEKQPNNMTATCGVPEVIHLNR